LHSRLRARQPFSSYCRTDIAFGHSAERGNTTIADRGLNFFKARDGRMLHLHEGWKRWLSWIALVSGGILFTTLPMK
jgi:hypothetical protein